MLASFDIQDSRDKKKTHFFPGIKIEYCFGVWLVEDGLVFYYINPNHLSITVYAKTFHTTGQSDG